MIELVLEHGQRGSRSGEPLSIALLGIDHFKTVHDTHGHAMGDEMLGGFLRQLRSMLREPDVIGHGAARNS